LNERAKELKCIYNVEELLMDINAGIDTIFSQLLEIIPPAWQYPTVCEVRIKYKDKTYMTEDFRESDWMQKANIVVDNNVEGEIQVYYIEFIRLINNSQFMPEEQKLLNSIAERVSNYIFHRRLKQSLEYLQAKEKTTIEEMSEDLLPEISDEHWKWRLLMAQTIAYKMDFAALGVSNVYVIGSTKNGTAGPASDLDLIVHFHGDELQRKMLKCWIEGWSLCLSEMNFMKTGYESNGLIDLHIITDEDIKNKTSYAVMLKSSSNSAKLLR
jgi:hypothetical protein